MHNAKLQAVCVEIGELLNECELNKADTARVLVHLLAYLCVDGVKSTPELMARVRALELGLNGEVKIMLMEQLADLQRTPEAEAMEESKGATKQ